ncbi:MAG: DUF6263 family protein [Prevotellaceae bacterium]|nr:DUF6263 family protein [Prevotellaceae bacterium]
MELTQELMGQEMKIGLTLSMKMTFEVKDVSSDTYTMEVKYKEMKVNTAMTGASISFDSNTPEDIATQQDLGPMLKAMIDKPVEVVITKTGKVESMKGGDKLLEAMLNSMDENIPELMKQQLTSQFGSQFSEEQLRSFFAQNSGYFPGRPVNVGDTWNQKISMPVSNFAMDIDMKMTLKSIDGNTVTLDSEGTFSTPEGYEADMNGMKVKASLKGVQKGPVKIDKNTGWTVSAEMVQSFSGKVEAGGMTMPLSATSTVSISND